MDPSSSAANEVWTAGEVLDASAELLAHLARSGIRFVPQADKHGVEQWSGAFAESVAGGAEEAKPVESARVGELGMSTSPPLEPSPVELSPVEPSPVEPSPVEPSPLAAVAGTGIRASDSVLPEGSGHYSMPALPVAQRSERLDALAQTVAGCTRCKVLAGCRTQTVFGEGNPQPRFVFFGEGPGAEEDKSGRPFVGQAGQLLTKMIEAMHLRREDVYLLNTVKCRPPGNRNPERDEVAHCREYFEAQLDLLRPEYIVCLGAVGSQALLDSKLSIGRLRQRFHSYRDSKVLVIYHPAYLLRNPDAKKAAWADLQMLMKDAGL